MESNVNPSLPAHLLEQKLHGFHIVSVIGASLDTCSAGTPLVESTRQLGHETRFVRRIDDPAQRPGRPDPSKRTVKLDQSRPGARTSGRDRSRNPGRSRSANDHIRLFDNRYIASNFSMIHVTTSLPVT
jgi:hypothetical protein